MTPSVSSRSQAPLSFLLVEDDDGHAQLMMHALRRGRHPLTVRRVADGDEALEYLHRSPPAADVELPDMILLDLNLPRVNGIEVLKRLKADEALRMIPVVMMTTSDEESDRVTAYRNYVNSYVVKPSEHDQFRRLVEDLTDYWGTWNRPAPIHN